MKPLIWSIRWMSKNKPPWKLLDLAEERRKQTYIRINKALKGLDTLVSEGTVNRNEIVPTKHCYR